MTQMLDYNKLDYECRVFKEQHNIIYFAIETNNKVLCIICNQAKVVLKEYIMKKSTIQRSTINSLDSYVKKR